MKFYQSIAEHYEQIFPLNKAQITFVKESFHGAKKSRLLDIGCGTGSLSIALSKLFETVTAIDLDESMIEKALQKKHKGIDFSILNMLDIKQTFGMQTFDAIICFGNTLVHLDGPESILEFYMQCKKLLKPNGKLLFQLINYDNIIDNNIQNLPTIENNTIKFIRNYNYRLAENIIDFETILTIKENGQQIKNTIQLYPLRQSEIDALLQKAGFSEWTYFGNFKRDMLSGNSLPLVVEVSY